MKNTILKSGLLALALISTIISCSKKEEGYTINGKFTDLKDGTVYLEFNDGDKKITDSTAITNGSFSFKGKVDQPLLYTIKLKGSEFGARFLLDNETITFQAKKDSVHDAKFSGAVQDSVYKSYYQNEFKKISKVAGSVYKISDSLTQNGKIKLTADQKAMLDKRWEDLQTFGDDLTGKFIKTHKDKLAAALIINERIVNYTPEKVTEYYALLTPEIQKSFYGKKLKIEIDIAEKTAIGATAPEFSQTDVNGKIIKLSDYKGKYVLVDFWASWCGPCRKENPYVVQAYKAYHDKGLDILGVSLDEKKDLWEKAIEKDGLIWTHISDLKGWKNEVAGLYGVKMVPTNYLIAPDGKIIAKNLREEALLAKLKEIFKQ
ncbi:peroxiredoxin [Flavobacterium sp. 2755]|uniref:TlpA disulfide reductase family protein n=1 Tax=Flavobacterium sp. 2755 TaxID=2817765 RepID=UPI0028670101|nr:TlpA disulfide reductase family protein [Flavobacterium sp. 2755]MDR6763677.1 peroxiredoxin [Flavobacterium sp. 2755]